MRNQREPRVIAVLLILSPSGQHEFALCICWIDRALRAKDKREFRSTTKVKTELIAARQEFIGHCAVSQA